MNIAFRVDSSSQLGSGHVMRCKTLADELRRRGENVEFVCCDLPGHLIGVLADAGYAVTILRPDAARDQAADAEATLAALKPLRPDWLVVDHYQLGESWERRIRADVGRILVIDDLADRRHDCDLLLDQGCIEGEPYQGLVPDECRTMLGPRYALLQPLFAQLRGGLPARDGTVRRILVFFGGVDASGQTVAALEALASPECSGLAVDVVVGDANPRLAAIERLAGARPGTTLHRTLPTLAGLMARADLMLAAGGVTTWERCCLGLPAIVTIASDNQACFTTVLAKAGVHLLLGRASVVGVGGWRDALRDFLASKDKVTACGAAASQVTDGLGLQRVAAALRPESGRPWVRVRSEGRAVLEDSHDRPVGVVRIGHDGRDVLMDIVADRGERVTASWLHALLETYRRSRQTPPRGEAYPGPGFIRRAGSVSSGAQGMLRLTVLSDRDSWLNDHLEILLFEWYLAGHAVRWVHDSSDLVPGDACFLLGCSAVLTADQLGLHRHTLVVHESDLPRGRGWSPLTWQVLEGRDRIPVTLFEAGTAVDTGPVYLQTTIVLDGAELVEELRAKQADATRGLCQAWVDRYPSIVAEARAQDGAATYYKRRTPGDSELDPDKPLSEQFNLLRVADYPRYPAFFSLRGERYVLSVRKAEPGI